MKVRTWLFMAIVTVAVLGLGLTSRASGEPPTPEPPLPLAASDVEKPPPGLQTSLYRRWRLATEVPAVPAADASVSAQYLSPVQVEILAAKDKVAEAIAAVERQGGSIQLTFENLIQAVVPPQTLLGLSQEPSILAVREPARLEPLVTTEGAGVVGTAAWHQAGITGQGVKVGVIDSFAGYQTLLGTELPPVSRVSYRNFTTSPGASEHGTAVAEIIYDVAPGVHLYLAETRTALEFGQAVDWLISQGVSVVNFSGGFPFGPPYGSSGSYPDPVGAAVDRAAQAGLLWINAAGNHAQRHWSGLWSDPDQDRYLNFAPGRELNGALLLLGFAPAGTAFVLTWDDPWGGACNDYDFELYYVDLFLGWMPLGFSYDRQMCGPADIPREIVTVPSHVIPADGNLYLAVRRAPTAQPKRLRIVADHVAVARLEFSVAQGSVLPPADRPSAFSVGAVAWNSPNVIEPYSSQGPTWDGRTKPDIVAPARVSTASYGPQGFPGTSAAAPHVAGAAALVKQANPSWGPTQIRQFLESRAVDLGAPGKDNVFGAGRLSLGQPGTSPTPTPSPTPSPTPPPPTPTAPPSPPALVSIQPHDLQRARVTWFQPQGVTFYRLCADFSFQFDSPFMSCRDIPAGEAPGELFVGVPWWDLGVVYYRLQACNQLGCSPQVRAGAVARRIWPGQNDWNFYMTAIDTFGFSKVAAMNASPVAGKVSDLAVWDGLAGLGGVIVNACRNVAPGGTCGPFTFLSGSWFASASQEFPPYGSVGVGVQVR